MKLFRKPVIFNAKNVKFLQTIVPNAPFQKTDRIPVLVNAQMDITIITTLKNIAKNVLSYAKNGNNEIILLLLILLS